MTGGGSGASRIPSTMKSAVVREEFLKVKLIVVILRRNAINMWYFRIELGQWSAVYV